MNVSPVKTPLESRMLWVIAADAMIGAAMAFDGFRDLVSPQAYAAINGVLAVALAGLRAVTVSPMVLRRPRVDEDDD